MSVLVEDYLSKKDALKYRGVSKRFSMKASNGAEAQILTYGALIEKLFIPDSSGNLSDIMLGLKGLDEYMASGSNHGSVVGRSANRIKGASFQINGVTYNVPKNDGPNNLHGGSPSYQNVFWDAEVISSEAADEFVKNSGIKNIYNVDGEAVLLKYTSPDGACGFPGNLDTQVLYAWTLDGMLLIMYRGVSDKDTIFAPTNHSYFNLAGHASGSVENHLMLINADTVTRKDDNNCPDGTIIPVEGTVFDFRDVDRVKKALTLNDPQTAGSKGIDQNFCLKGKPGTLSFAASLVNPFTNRIMEVLTDMPGLQIYAGNHLGGTDQKGDTPYEPYGGICLEAQMYPNAINVPAFESPVIKAGEVKYHACGYRFNA